MPKSTVARTEPPNPQNSGQAGRSGQQDRGLSSTLVLALGTFAVGTDAFVIAGFLPDLARDLGVSAAAAGQSVTVFAVCYAVFAPIIATLTSHVARRRVLVCALLVLAVANVFAALSTDLPMMIAARVLAAAGAAAYTPNAGAASAALVRPQIRARALAVVIGGLTIATALGVPLGSLASHWFSWRVVLAGVAVLSLLVATGIGLSMPSVPGNPPTALLVRLAVLRRPGVLAVLPLTVLGMAACYTAYAYSVPAFQAAGVSLRSAGSILFLYGVGAVLGNLLAGYVTDRVGARRVLALAYLIMIISLGGMSWLIHSEAVIPVLVGLLALGWGAGSWAQTPPQQHRLIEAAPGETPLVVSLNASAIYLGIGLGTTLGGAVYQAGFPTVYGVGAVGAAIALVYLLATSRPAR